MSWQRKAAPSFEDWLAAARGAVEGRSEYVRGEILAMTGASEPHHAIVANLFGGLWTQMKGPPCRVYASDMEVRIRTPDVGVYPDLVALCGERLFEDGRLDLADQPEPDRRGAVCLDCGL